MKKRAFIVHGWDGYPEEGWFPYLKQELEKKGFEVSVPQLPQADKPRIQNWVPALSEVVGTVDENTFFVGHSMGVQTIARLLESLPNGVKAGGAVFVAGFFKRLTGLEDNPDVQETDKHWLETPIDLNKVKSHLLKSVAIFSSNDPYVPLDNQDDFKNILQSEIKVVKDMRHFSGEEGTFELPIALESVLSIASSYISIEDFAKVEIKIGKVIDCTKAENADKLLLLQFDLGTEKRQVVSAIAEWYQPEDLIGKFIPVITNLEPRKFRGYESQGMILATEKDGKPTPLSPLEEVPPGSIVR